MPLYNMNDTDLSFCSDFYGTSLSVLDLILLKILLVKPVKPLQGNRCVPNR